jgi:hypothetical protein
MGPDRLLLIAGLLAHRTTRPDRSSPRTGSAIGAPSSGVEPYQKERQPRLAV